SILRPSRLRALGLIATALALPLAYEVFRAGYYGIVVPMPALAKSATGAAWSRGWEYLVDFVQPYRLWLPLGVLAGFGIASRRALADRARIVVAAPLATALLLVVFIIRVGGDFMHARMLLPPTFLAVLPAMVLPISRHTAPVAALIAIWAVTIGVSL